MKECRFHVETKIIDVDFTQGAEIYDRIAQEIKGLEIGVLVNNVGMSYKYPEYLAQVISTHLFFSLEVVMNSFSTYSTELADLMNKHFFCFLMFGWLLVGCLESESFFLGS